MYAHTRSMEARVCKWFHYRFLSISRGFPIGRVALRTQPGRRTHAAADTCFRIVSTNVNQMTEDVIDGKLDYMTEDPTGDLLPQVKAKYGDRFRLDASPPNTYFFFMNTSTAPFDKLQASIEEHRIKLKAG